LPELFAGGGNLDYSIDTHLSINVNSIKKDLQKSILVEILTFPIEFKGCFVEEYVLPQMLTTKLKNEKYDGIIFPSTRDYTCLTNNHLFAEFDINTALFVNYDPVLDYDKNLQNTFFVFTFDGTEKLFYNIKDVLDRMELVFIKNRTSSQNNNDFILPLVKTKLYIEYLEKSLLNGVPYFETKEGKIELEFYFKLVEKMDTYIK
jgi:hypothetical protein